MTQSGYDLGLPSEVTKKQRLEVFREYLGADGKPITQVKLGDEVEVHVEATQPKQCDAVEPGDHRSSPGGLRSSCSPGRRGRSGRRREKQDKSEDGSGEGHEGGDGEGGDHEGGITKAAITRRGRQR